MKQNVCLLALYFDYFTFSFTTPLNSSAFSLHLCWSTVPQMWSPFLLDSFSSDLDEGRACVHIHGCLQKDSRGNKNQEPDTLTDIFLRQSKTMLLSQKYSSATHLPLISRIKWKSSSRGRRRGWRFMAQAPLFSPCNLPSPACNCKPISSPVPLFCYQLPSVLIYPFEEGR